MSDPDEKAKAIMDYVPSPYDEDALALKAGEEVIILERIATGMWRGKRVTDGVVGVFPFRFIHDPNDSTDDDEEDNDGNESD
jgi:hypothetical protein